jgi:hypothetical protein
MKRLVVIKQLDYEASAGWTTYGTSLASFSLFQGVEKRHIRLLRKSLGTHRFQRARL